MRVYTERVTVGAGLPFVDARLRGCTVVAKAAVDLGGMRRARRGAGGACAAPCLRG